MLPFKAHQLKQQIFTMLPGGDENAAQRLRALAAAPEVKFGFRHPHRHLNSEALGDLVPSSGICGHHTDK